MPAEDATGEVGVVGRSDTDVVVGAECWRLTDDALSLASCSFKPLEGLCLVSDEDRTFWEALPLPVPLPPPLLDAEDKEDFGETLCPDFP